MNCCSLLPARPPSLPPSHTWSRIGVPKLTGTGEPQLGPGPPRNGRGCPTPLHQSLSCPLTQSHPTSAGFLVSCHPNRSDTGPHSLSGMGHREVSPLSVGIPFISVLWPPRHRPSLEYQTVTVALETQLLTCVASRAAPSSLGPRWWAGRWGWWGRGVYARVCLVCCPRLEGSQPCETSPLDVTLGCCKCSFTSGGGEWAGAGCRPFYRVVCVAG